jgi:hypothetical protein
MATRAPSSSYAPPAQLVPLYQAAGAAYGVPWQVLAAVNKVETDYGRLAHVTSSAGAIGWMQFLPATWARWGTRAHGDGRRPDPYDPADAIYSAARYIAASGRGDVSRGLFAYNHSHSYVSSVLSIAQRIGYGGGGSSRTSSASPDFQPGTSPMTPGGNIGKVFPHLTADPWVDWQHVDLGLLRGLNYVAGQLGVTARLTSGYRSDTYSAAHGGFKGDPHTKAVAGDVYIGSTPIGNYPGALALLQKMGLRSGATDPQFYKGKPDPEHVDLIGKTDKPRSFWAKIGGAVAAGGLVGIPGVGPIAAGAGAASSLGLPGLPDPSGVLDPVLGPLESVGTVFSEFISDPAKPFLYLLFFLLGFALIYVGLMRLLGRGPTDIPIPPPEV